MISAMRMDLRRLASRRAQKLTDELEETVHLAILMNGMCVIIDRFSPSKPFLLIPQVGSAVPAHCTATGKVLLSQMNDTQLKAVVERCKLDSYTKHTVSNLEQLRQQLEEVRLKGYAISDQEALLGLTCIAAPIMDYTGSVTASLSVAGSSESFMEEGRTDNVIDAVVEAAKEISSCLGYEV
jgi:IclR family transcriptional regulator, KDG regulon repressor